MVEGKKKRFWRCAALFLAALLALMAAYRIYRTNIRAARIPCTVYGKGEEVDLGRNVTFADHMDGYSITVRRADILTTDEFLEKYNCTRQDIPGWEAYPKIFDLEVAVANKDNQDTGINLLWLYLQNKSAYLSFDGINGIYFRLANARKGDKNTSIAVRPGTEVTLHLEFPVPKYSFTKRAYRDLEGMDLRLVVTLYPHKKMIRLE